MSLKVYQKLGKKNYKENRYITKLQEALEKKFAQNPALQNGFKPATSFDELEKLYNEHVIETVDFVETKDNTSTTTASTEEQHQNFRDNMSAEKTETVSTSTSEGAGREDNSFIDPLNREEPIVRDYVTKDEFPDASNATGQSTQKTFFDEPTSFQDSFEMPDAQEANGGNNKQSANTSSANNQQQGKQQTKSQPANPAFDEMNAAKKRKSTRKFAKYIVETVCMLSEKGFVWYANKDINEGKLAEYELTGEVDLSLLITLGDGQEATVKQFFQIQALKAEQLCKIDKEEKEDLADALAEVLLEKGVGPTPTQELLLISLKIFGGQVVTLIALKSESNSVLMQLKEMNAGYAEQRQRSQPQQEQRKEPMHQAPEPEYQPRPTHEPATSTDLQTTNLENETMEQLQAEMDKTIIENPIDTKE